MKCKYPNKRLTIVPTDRWFFDAWEFVLESNSAVVYVLLVFKIFSSSSKMTNNEIMQGGA